MSVRTAIVLLFVEDRDRCCVRGRREARHRFPTRSGPLRAAPGESAGFRAAGRALRACEIALTLRL
jgi:hypothetical protein